MKTECSTDTGPARKINEDACACGQFSPASSWGIVCDGMGGANGGDVASALAAKTLEEYLTREFDQNLSKENIKAMMLNAARRANDAVHKLSMEKPELQGMGTTVVIMIATKGTLHVVHAGDSRAYLHNENGLTQITMDHSYVQDLVNFGQITPKEARVHPRRNIITRVLGVHDELECDYDSVDFAPGDIALACSDGLSNFMEDELISQYIDTYRYDYSTLAKKLIQYAVDNGGSDNITVTIIGNE